tara:strand:+ start:848 stop:1687 length:840 start_codon:yes stop_codon:yes gene_type:complete
MRIGSPTSNNFILELNQINKSIEEEFIKKITFGTSSLECNVMLGDSTTKKVESFDIKKIEDFFSQFNKRLTEWNSQGITYTSDEDLKRIFSKFEIKINNYIISLHISLQYHVLLYYKPDQRVIDLQKELSGLIDNSDGSESKFADEGERLIIEKLKELGFKDMPKQELFELFYNDDKLSEKIKKMIDNSQPEIVDVQKKKNEMFKQLDNLLMEIYQTTPVLIDEQKLVNGEEGCLCNIDLEYIDNGSKQGLFDMNIISDNEKFEIKSNVEKILEIIKSS